MGWWVGGSLCNNVVLPQTMLNWAVGWVWVETICITTCTVGYKPLTMCTLNEMMSRTPAGLLSLVKLYSFSKSTMSAEVQFPMISFMRWNWLNYWSWIRWETYEELDDISIHNNGDPLTIPLCVKAGSVGISAVVTELPFIGLKQLTEANEDSLNTQIPLWGPTPPAELKLNLGQGNNGFGFHLNFFVS